MPNIIDTTFFVGQLAVPQLEQAAVTATLQAMIDKLEPEYMRKVLGYKTYKDFVAGITGEPWLKLLNGAEYVNRYGVEDKWRGFKVGKTSPIANYVFYYWLRKEASASTGGGEKILKAQNAVETSSMFKQTRVWNEMVEWNKELWDFLFVHQADYPNYLCFGPYSPSNQHSELFKVINDLNL